jgi:hypothetical protein
MTTRSTELREASRWCARLACVAAAACFVIPALARADDGPSPEIFGLVAEQVGQDVRITATASTEHLRLTRTPAGQAPDGGDAEVVADDWLDWTWTSTIETGGCANLGSEGAYISAEEVCGERPDLCADCDADGVAECYPECGACESWFAPDCAKLPDWCVDCDADGEVDCYLGCEEGFVYETMDACVPPGANRYELSVIGWIVDLSRSVTIPVDDESFAACAPPGEAGDRDAGTRDETSMSGGVGCGVAAAARERATVGLFAMILSFGS